MNKERSYFHSISQHITPYSRVLDLGCGDGSLLVHLKHKKGVQGYGIDIDIKNIQACIHHGISIFQGNIEEGLKEFGDQSYDYVILSQTLQEVYDPVFILSEMVRIGKQGIVTFPNFGYWKIRLRLLLSGHSPKSKSLPYDWYNTPNIRVITIKDFRSLCKKNNFNITKELSLIGTSWNPLKIPLYLTNLLSQKGMFFISR